MAFINTGLNKTPLIHCTLITSPWNVYFQCSLYPFSVTGKRWRAVWRWILGSVGQQSSARSHSAGRWRRRHDDGVSSAATQRWWQFNAILANRLQRSGLPAGHKQQRMTAQGGPATVTRRRDYCPPSPSSLTGRQPRVANSRMDVTLHDTDRNRGHSPCQCHTTMCRIILSCKYRLSLPDTTTPWERAVGGVAYIDTISQWTGSDKRR